jgi:hypothetical protein
VAAAAVMLALSAPNAARAAATGRLQVFPSQPRVAEAAMFQLRPFWTYVDHLEPAIFRDDYPWRVGVFAPRGRAYPVPVRKSPADPYSLSGTFRFPSGGTWTVCVLNFQTFPYARYGCSPSNPTRQRVRVLARRASVDVWHRLERPLQISGLATTEACPTSAPGGDLAQLGPGFPTATAWGPGPAYPVLPYARDTPLLTFQYPPQPESGFYGSEWGGQKALWLVAPAYNGPLLVRGRQLDGPNELRFQKGLLPSREFRIVGGRDHPSITRVREPGCYAYQIDAPTFSYTIVFKAAAFPNYSRPSPWSSRSRSPTTPPACPDEGI